MTDAVCLGGTVLLHDIVSMPVHPTSPHSGLLVQIRVEVVRLKVISSSEVRLNRHVTVWVMETLESRQKSPLMFTSWNYSAVLTFKHTHIHTVHCKGHTLLHILYMFVRVPDTHISLVVCMCVCSWRGRYTGWVKLQCTERRREEEGGWGRMSLSAYLTTEYCTCCGCQVAGRFTSRAELPCWSDF